DLPCAFFLLALSPPEIYTLPLHDALPIFEDLTELRLDLVSGHGGPSVPPCAGRRGKRVRALQSRSRRPFYRTSCPPATSPSGSLDRKSTRLNSSHVKSSYAVFCVKKTRVF